MIAQNHHFLCKQVEPYYYDFLYGGNQEPIPEFVFDHVEQCQHCHEQIELLRVVLSQVGGTGPGREQASRAAITMLELHFAYVGERVTCKTVRPFIPGLLDPDLQIRVPTPITVHLDNCRQCSENLEAIRKLNISPKQLRRLSQMFVEESSYDAIECSGMEATARSVVALNFGGISDDDLEHLCKCPVCRGLLFDERQKLYNSLPKNAKSTGFSCDSVLATDIFDYVLLKGLDPTSDQYLMFRESLASHLRSCPTCLAKMQKLHRTIYDIAEMAESGVVTVFHMDESTESQTEREPDNLYAGFPINVEVIGRQEKVGVNQSRSANGLVAALKQKISTINLKPIAASVAVAAVLLVGFALVLNPLTARAVTIEQIYNAIEKVKNVCISSYVSDKTVPVQEIFVSRKLNIYLTKTRERSVLLDLAKRIKKDINLNTGSIKTTSIPDDLFSVAQQRINGSLGLVPFYDISRLPKNAEWRNVSDEIEEVAEGIEVYDLDWTEEQYGGSTIYRKWRIFADTKEHLPQRAEWYNKFNNDAKFELETVLVVEYMNESQIQAAVEKIFF